MIRISYLLVLALAGPALSSGEEAKQDRTKDVPSLINTSINLFGAPLSASMRSDSDVVIDPSRLVDEEALARQANDLEEDEDDRFITSRSGKLRPKFQQDPDSDNWSEEAGAPVATTSGKALSRVKRCGGGGGGDDDGGDANRSRRSRRARRARRARRRKAEKKAQQNSTTTTVTRRVIQNGQVVSETSGVQPQAVPTVQSCSQQPAPQPIIIQQQPAAVVPGAQVVQPAPVVQQVHQPVVQHVQPAAAPAVAATQPVQVVQAPQPAQAAPAPAGAAASASGSFKVSI